MFWCEGSPVVFSVKNWIIIVIIFFEEPYLWFWILKLINYNLQTLYSTADYFHTKLLELFPSATHTVCYESTIFVRANLSLTASYLFNANFFLSN